MHMRGSIELFLIATRLTDARITFKVLHPLFNFTSCFLQGTFYLQKAR